LSVNHRKRQDLIKSLHEMKGYTEYEYLLIEEFPIQANLSKSRFEKFYKQTVG